jgi:hypothetical protein
MGDRERDERDLDILTACQNGATKASLMRTHKVTLRYINKLLKEANHE